MLLLFADNSQTFSRFATQKRFVALDRHNIRRAQAVQFARVPLQGTLCLAAFALASRNKQLLLFELFGRATVKCFELPVEVGNVVKPGLSCHFCKPNFATPYSAPDNGKAVVV